MRFQCQPNYQSYPSKKQQHCAPVIFEVLSKINAVVMHIFLILIFVSSVAKGASFCIPNFIVPGMLDTLLNTLAVHIFHSARTLAGGNFLVILIKFTEAESALIHMKLLNSKSKLIKAIILIIIISMLVESQCPAHKNGFQWICKDPECPIAFACNHQECLNAHFHSDSMINISYLKHKLSEFTSSDLTEQFYKMGKDLVQKYFDQSTEQLMNIINQYKEEAMLQLEEFKQSAKLCRSQKDDAMLLMLHKDMFTASKKQILQGWRMLKDGYGHFFDKTQMNIMIQQLQERIRKLPELMQRLQFKQIFNFNILSDLNVTPAQQTELFALLSEMKIKPYNLRPLFNSKEHGYDAEKFHQICDNKGKTLTLIRSSTGCLFGGYSPVSFKSHGGYCTAPGAFLFSVDLKSICQIYQNEGRAFYTGAGYGPCWGDDLYIANYCNSNNYSYSYVNYSYKFKKEGIQTNTFDRENNYTVENYLVLEVNDF